MKNKLSDLIAMERAKITLAKEKNVTIAEIQEDIAKYIDVDVETIKAYKRGLSYPSLPVALKLAKYLNVNVEDIFKLEDVDFTSDREERKGQGRGRKRSVDVEFCHCGEKPVAKGLCMKHYQQERRGQKQDVNYSEDCSVCGEPVYIKGLCKNHYAQSRQQELSKNKCDREGCDNKAQKVLNDELLCQRHYKELKGGRECKENGCTDLVHARDLCMNHYQFKRKYNMI